MRFDGHDPTMPVTRTLVHTTYLEISANAPLRPPSRPRPAYELRQAIAITPDFARFLYRGVGYPWNWTRRAGWSYAKWERYLADEGGEIWVAYVSGTVAGYFELVDEGDNGVEIRQFGMFPSFTGPRPGRPSARRRRGTRALDRQRTRLAAHLHGRSPARARQLPGARDAALQERGRVR